MLLEESAGASWRSVSTRVGEADAEIADLMGMSADQFFQVVLLPQGEFARFLHADAGDRAKLLQRLFGTDRFHAVEEWLADRRRTTAREVEEAEGGIATLIARVAQAAGVEVPSAEPAVWAAHPAAPAEPAAWAMRLAAAAAAESAASASQVADHRRDLDQALDLQREVARLADRQRRRQAALRTRAELARTEADVDVLRPALAAAAQAAEVTPALAEAERTADVLAQARAAEERAGSRPGPRPTSRPPGCEKRPSSRSRCSAAWKRCARYPGRRRTKTRPPPQRTLSSRARR